MAIYPWEFHPDLQAGRLQLIATVLRDTRRGALTRHDAAAGDTAWSLGCTVYARSTQMLMRAGEDLWAEWFKVIQEPLQFVFGIGEVPVRFYSGDAEDPDPKHMRLCKPEMIQLGLLQEDGASELIWRIAVETDMGSDVERIVLFGSTKDGVTRCFYEIPDDNVVALITPIAPNRTPGNGVELPPAAVKVRKNSLKKDDDKGTV